MLDSKPLFSLTSVFQTHQYRCPRFPISCPNRCDPTKIPREEVEIHVQELCPSATVDCPFRDAGCRHKVKLASVTNDFVTTVP